MRSVCGLDVHKDSVFLCILCETVEIFENVYGVLTHQLHGIDQRVGSPDHKYSRDSLLSLGNFVATHQRKNEFFYAFAAPKFGSSENLS